MSNALDSLRSSFERLSGRERRLVLLTLVVAATLLVTGIVMWTHTALGDKQARLRNQEQQLGEIRSYEEAYKQAETEERRAINRLKSNRISLFSRLNEAAKKLGLNLKDLNEREVPVKDADVKEIQVEVNLRNVSIDKLGEFLKEIEGESNAGLVKIVKLKVKTRHDNEEMLDVTMTVATWKSS